MDGSLQVIIQSLIPGILCFAGMVLLFEERKSARRKVCYPAG